MGTLCESFLYLVDEELEGFKFFLIKDGELEVVQDLNKSSIAGPYDTPTEAITGRVDLAMSLDRGNAVSHF